MRPNALVILTLAAALGACGEEAVPPPQEPVAPPVDVASRRAASAQLVAEAQAAPSAVALAGILGAMEAVGGREVVAYCLRLGENEAAPVELRKSALAVLLRWADRNNPAIRARSAAIWERVSALSAVR